MGQPFFQHVRTFRTREVFVPTVICLLFLALFSSISLVNHYQFRTSAWDLGIETNAMYDYAHFRWNDCMLMQPQFTNVLSDHFSLLTALLSPLIYLFGSYTLLIVQILAIGAGGIGMYRLVRLQYGDFFLSWTALLFFFSLWGIYSALSFDFHHNVLGTMLVPWFLYFFAGNRWKAATLLLAAVLISKENMAFWMVFINLGLLWLYFRNREKRRHAAWFAVASLAYFIVIMAVVMPALADGNRGYLHFGYDALGANFTEALQTVFTQPRKAFTLLFENNTNDSSAFGIKSELHFNVLLSGGWSLFTQPQYIVMLVPVYAQKLFFNEPVKWGLDTHYSIEFVPILTLSLFSWLHKIKAGTWRRGATIASIALAMAATAGTMDSSQSLIYSYPRIRFYQAEHYQRAFDVNELHRALKRIPADARVSATFQIVPHLSLRQWIYQFPVVEDAEYVVVLSDAHTFPLDPRAQAEEVARMRNSGAWETVYDENHTVILKKRAG